MLCDTQHLHRRLADWNDMSPRKRSAHSGAHHPAKRRRTDIGSHQADDDIPTPQAQANAPSASALSTRTLQPEHIPTLSTVCVRVFAENLRKLSSNESTWEDARWWLKQLPDALSQKVFTGLRSICPTILRHGLIVAVCLLSYIFGSDDAH